MKLEVSALPFSLMVMEEGVIVLRWEGEVQEKHHESIPRQACSPSLVLRRGSVVG